MPHRKGNSLLLIFAISLIVFGIALVVNQKFGFVELPKILNTNKTTLYKSPKFKYQIEYSRIFSLSENSETGDVLLFPSDKPAELGNEAILISVHHKSGDEITGKRPLEEYAKTAAIEEIQNYNELNSIETVITKSGEIGYKTTWNRSGPFANGVELNTKNEPSLPITYFGFPKEPSYTVQFYLYNEDYSSDYQQILDTFVTNKAD